MFGLIGLFVLLLACINFMNLSTARSERRAREVGIRKAMGSLRLQLIGQFLGESLLITGLAILLSLGLALLAMPWFNQVADKQMSIPWGKPLFWLLIIGFALVTGLIAGSYPAFYLSSFNPVKVLKGRFKAGRLASLPRKILVVLQFTVSVALIIGTLIVFREIQYVRNRPMGYERKGLFTIYRGTPELIHNYTAILQWPHQQRRRSLSAAFDPAMPNHPACPIPAAGSFGRARMQFGSRLRHRLRRPELRQDRRVGVPGRSRFLQPVRYRQHGPRAERLPP